jgi:hypothetical protein
VTAPKEMETLGEWWSRHQTAAMADHDTADWAQPSVAKLP